MQGRVIILMHCTPPQYVLSTYEVSSWYLKYVLRYAPDKNVGRKDGRKVGRTDEDYFYIPRRLSAGDKNIQVYLHLFSVVNVKTVNFPN
jgi:hypothetical protein